MATIADYKHLKILHIILSYGEVKNALSLGFDFLLRLFLLQVMMSKPVKDFALNLKYFEK